jgi:hypothetical protein
MNSAFVRRALTALAIVVAPMVSQASTLNFTAGSGTPLTVSLNNGSTSITAAIDPYTAKLNGASTNTLIYCIDPLHDAPPAGVTETYNVSTTGSGFASTMQGVNISKSANSPWTGSVGADAKANLYAGSTPTVAQLGTFYGALAYLAQQLQNATNASNSMMAQEYQSAIWDLADYNPGFISYAPSAYLATQGNTQTTWNTTYRGLETAAASNAVSMANQFQIWTDAREATSGTSDYQEYLVLTPTATPEPASLMLLATGLAGFAARRKRLF